MNTAPAHTAAGWYPDPTGHLRWWDGHQWGQYAPPAQTALPAQAPSRAMGIAALVLGLLALPGLAIGIIFSALAGFLFAFIPGTLAVIFGWVAVARAKKTGRADTLAGAGVALGAISLLAGPLVEFLP